MKIHSEWAFKENALELAAENTRYYERLRNQHKVGFSHTCDIHDYDVVLETIGNGYACTKYKVLANTAGLSTEELALLCDRGNLCFGYRVEGNGRIIVVHTD